jgi:pyruvate dehydrogenase E2 component (dihydrolipoyllysine-residue acetyltransferase)
MDVTMPQLGETVTEGTLIRWLREPGASVAEGDPLFEVATDKVDTEVPAPGSGILSKILVQVDETVPVGTRLAVITADPPKPASASPAPTHAGPAGAARHRATPLVRRMLADHGLEPDQVAGTGPAGRITRADAQAAIAARAEPPPAPAPTPAPTPAPPPAPAPDGSTVVPFSTIRRRTAEHMVRSKATSPHTLMAMEVDFAAVDAVRRPTGPRPAPGSLTYLPFVARAVVDAIADHPHVNATVGDAALLVHSSVHLGIAVDLDNDGLVVPVVRDAADKRLLTIAREIRTLAERARARRLGADELVGATFTITNPGPYGTSLTGAIINQPQVAILATDAVRPRPVAVSYPDGSYGITVHPVGNLALSFDHRAFDGGYAARFLATVKRILERRDWSVEL